VNLNILPDVVFVDEDGKEDDDNDLDKWEQSVTVVDKVSVGLVFSHLQDSTEMFVLYQP